MRRLFLVIKAGPPVIDQRAVNIKNNRPDIAELLCTRRARNRFKRPFVLSGAGLVQFTGEFG
jgi:hypothetical protein